MIVAYPKYKAFGPGSGFRAFDNKPDAIEWCKNEWERSRKDPEPPIYHVEFTATGETSWCTHWRF